MSQRQRTGVRVVLLDDDYDGNGCRGTAGDVDVMTELDAYMTDTVQKPVPSHAITDDRDAPRKRRTVHGVDGGITRRESKKRHQRRRVVMAACGDAVPVRTSEPVQKRQRAEERRISDSFPSWDMNKAMEGLVIPPNPNWKPRPPRVHNVVATAKCANCVPGMHRLAWLIGGLHARGEFAHPVTAAFENEGATTASQTETGVVNLTGAKSSRAALIAYYAYIAVVARHLSIPLTLEEFAVSNTQATFHVGGYVDLQALHAAVPQSIYRQDVIRHVAIAIEDPHAVVLVWTSGAVVVTGCHRAEDHVRVYEKFGLFLSQFVRAGSGGTTTNGVGKRGYRRATGVTKVHMQATGHVGLRPTLWD